MFWGLVTRKFAGNKVNFRFLVYIILLSLSVLKSGRNLWNIFLNTRLRGNIALTDSYHTNLALQKDNTLYKFIWVQSGSLQLEIDHVPTTLMKGEIIPLTPLHHIEFKAINGEYLTLLFNSNFYCIFGHDNEVSCNGFHF